MTCFMTYRQLRSSRIPTVATPDLLPGTYRIHLVVGDFQAGPGDTIPSAEPFELTNGQQLTRDFVFVRRRLVITLLQADGKTPAANVTCMLNGDQAMLRDQTTDQDGRLVVDPAPASAFYVQPRNARQALGPVRLPEGQSSGAVRLTLPAPETPK